MLDRHSALADAEVRGLVHELEGGVLVSLRTTLTVPLPRAGELMGLLLARAMRLRVAIAVVSFMVAVVVWSSGLLTAVVVGS